jgi:hypothetical protein
VRLGVLGAAVVSVCSRVRTKNRVRICGDCILGEGSSGCWHCVRRKTGGSGSCKEPTGIASRSVPWAALSCPELVAGGTLIGHLLASSRSGCCHCGRRKTGVSGSCKEPAGIASRLVPSAALSCPELVAGGTLIGHLLARQLKAASATDRMRPSAHDCVALGTLAVKVLGVALAIARAGQRWRERWWMGGEDQQRWQASMRGEDQRWQGAPRLQDRLGVGVDTPFVAPTLTTDTAWKKRGQDFCGAGALQSNGCRGPQPTSTELDAIRVEI